MAGWVEGWRDRWMEGGKELLPATCVSVPSQEARLSQEQLADQVVRASEERQTMENEMKAAQKVHVHVCTCASCTLG